jgi:hypothetical protein
MLNVYEICLNSEKTSWDLYTMINNIGLGATHLQMCVVRQCSWVFVVEGC